MLFLCFTAIALSQVVDDLIDDKVLVQGQFHIGENCYIRVRGQATLVNGKTEPLSRRSKALK